MLSIHASCSVARSLGTNTSNMANKINGIIAEELSQAADRIHNCIRGLL